MAISQLMQQMAEALAEDLEVGVSKKAKSKLTGMTQNKTLETAISAESYVDRYGKEFPGFLTFNEFKDIYTTHVYFANEILQKKPMPDDNKLLALFNAIDTENRNRISRDFFAKFVVNKRPAGTFLEKITNKALKGRERFVAAITQQLTQADEQFGSHGVLPVAVFQTIMVDFGLPLTESDRPDMLKLGFFFVDKDKQSLVDYKKLIKKITPDQKLRANSNILMLAALKIQKVFRGYIFRKKYKVQREKELKELSTVIQKTGSKRADRSKKRESLDKEKKEKEKQKDKQKRGVSREQ